MYTRGLNFYCVIDVSLFSFTDLILRFMNMMNDGQMDRGNENPTQHLPWWLVGTGIWIWDLPIKSPVCYHCATLLGKHRPIKRFIGKLFVAFFYFLLEKPAILPSDHFALNAYIPEVSCCITTVGPNNLMLPKKQISESRTF